VPDRLAILAPEPPPLLVERVRAWDGEVWECCKQRDACYISDGREPQHEDDWDFLHCGDTWPEAVRAALGLDDEGYCIDCNTYPLSPDCKCAKDQRGVAS
jgi:hypothetical protein